MRHGEKNIKLLLNKLMVIDFRGMNLQDHNSCMFYTDRYLIR
jgi:hypothetical protein